MKTWFRVIVASYDLITHQIPNTGTTILLTYNQHELTDIVCYRDIAREAYQQAVVFFEKELQSKTDAHTLIFGQPTSIEEVRTVVEQAKIRYDASVLGRRDILKSLHKFSSRIMYYTQVLDVLAQHHPEYLALVWGSMKFIFVVRPIFESFSSNSHITLVCC